MTNEFTLKRVDGDVTFKRGDYVKAWLSDCTYHTGYITGISEAKKEARVGKVWFEFGRIYKAEGI